MPDDARLLTGWGLTAPTRAELAQVEGIEGLKAALTAAPPRGVAVRGLGRSYGDAAQNAGGLVLDLTGLNRVLAVDAERGALTSEAGVSFDAVMRHLVPSGWFVPVTPGTRHVTIGGAIATDVHGKNHHREGTFGMHVECLDLVTADGTVRTLSPEEDPEGFWATVGGMGLTGAIVAARVRLIPIETAWMRVTTERAPDLDATMAALNAADAAHRYAVAWVDCLATGRRLGRGIVMGGDHAAVADLPPRAGHNPLAYAPTVRLRVPRAVPGRLLNRVTAAAFNEAWYRKAPRRREGALETLTSFFHPLDGVAEWNRLYGSRGFLQYQMVVPDAAASLVAEAIELLARARIPSFLTVLKRFGSANPAPLSFPRLGWTLALDIPNRGAVGAVLDQIDERVAEAGGAVYLAKDSRLRPALLPQMYPRLQEWRDVRRRLDPNGVFSSDLSRRLGL